MKKLVLAISVVVFSAWSASAADMAPVYTKAPPPVVAPSWTGFYLGLNAGYAWNQNSADLVAIDPIFFIPGQNRGVLPTSLDPNSSGFVGGGQAGYNWQFGQYVAGLESDIDYANMRGTASVTTAIPLFAQTTTTVSNQLQWLGTTRARLGWLPVPSTMLFATGGIAYGGASASDNVTITPNNGSSCPSSNIFCALGSASKTLVGWTVGGGLESMIAAHWTAKIEYLYYDLGRLSSPFVETAYGGGFGLGGTTVMSANSKFAGSILRAGVNYKF